MKMNGTLPVKVTYCLVLRLIMVLYGGFLTFGIVRVALPIPSKYKNSLRLLEKGYTKLLSEQTIFVMCN
mgnify:FL=1|jgi:hypothetical protein